MRYRDLLETHVDEIETAAWWLTRWISGSMDDPDWDDSWTTFGIERAFAILSTVVGNHLSIGKPLWRFLYLPKSLAKEIIKTRLLPPYDKSPFQSFTLSRQIAEIDGPDLIGRVPQRTVKVLIAAQPPSEAILFGMADLKRSRHPAIQDALLQTEDWHHQQEVIAQVTSPLPLLDVSILASR